MLHLKIITPQKIALEDDVIAVTAPSTQGEITILPRHVNLFTQLVEGIIKIKPEKYLAIGGGYLETDGEEINILVSRAYGQNEIDSEQTQKAIEKASNETSSSLLYRYEASQKKKAYSIFGIIY